MEILDLFNYKGFKRSRVLQWRLLNKLTLTDLTDKLIEAFILLELSGPSLDTHRTELLVFMPNYSKHLKSFRYESRKSNTYIAR